MPRRALPRPKPGDYLTAQLFVTLFEEMERLNLTVGDNLILSKNKQGMTLTAAIPDQFWAKITGAAVTLGSGAVIYPWTEQLASATGTWSDGPRTGTTTLDGGGVPTGDPAMETNKNDGVPVDGSIIVLLTRTRGVLSFLYRACS